MDAAGRSEGDHLFDENCRLKNRIVQLRQYRLACGHLGTLAWIDETETVWNCPVCGLVREE